MSEVHSIEGQTEELRRHFGDDPWKLVVQGIDPALAGQDETLFALGNGYLGLRGNHEEGRPLGSHGTFVNGLHETWRIHHAENAYGFAEHGQTMVNVPDAKTVRIYVDDERLNLESSDILDVRRELDLRSGVLSRSLVWLTPTGKRVRVDTRRMVSLDSRHTATLEMRVTLLDADAELTMSSLLVNRQDVGREDAAAQLGAERAAASTVGMPDPRKSDELGDRVFHAGPARHDARRSIVSYRIASSDMRLGVGVEHRFDGGGPVVFDGVLQPDGADSVAGGVAGGAGPGASPGAANVADAWHSRVETSGDRTRRIYQGTARAGRTVILVKTMAYHASATASLPELCDRCAGTLAKLAAEPPEARWEAQRAAFDAFWARSDVRVDAEPGVQQAVRWNLFQLAQATARADGRGIAAKGVTGSGYSGHYFWDTEIYVMPFLSYTTPLWARNALRARARMLPLARQRAATLSERGALFPWRTINGEEASAYYAAGTAAYHINADISYALERYVAASGDTEFVVQGASDIAVETARLWASLGFWRAEGGQDWFHIHGVTGPDEYTTVVNDNLFTNVMARRNLRFAAEVVRRLADEEPEAYAALVERLQLEAGEADEWQRAADAMFVPYSAELGVHPQDAHFLEREVWDLAATPPEQKPLLLHFHPLVIYRFQVLKQADVVLALLLASESFTAEEKRRDFEYYDALTTGDSTLSAVVQSVVAAEVGYRELAYRYFDHALRVDLDDLHRNSADGVHIASAGGVWLMLVQGFAGMRDAGRRLSFDPRLPEHWGSVAFVLAWRGQRVHVTLTHTQMSFKLDQDAGTQSGAAGGSAMSVWVRGTQHHVVPEERLDVPLDGQGPDLGVFRGLSAGMLPREGDTGTLDLGPIPSAQPRRSRLGISRERRVS